MTSLRDSFDYPYLDDPNSAYYMNGNDIEEDASWVWGYPGGEEMTYTNWYQGEPSRNNEPERYIPDNINSLCVRYFAWYIYPLHRDFEKKIF